MTRDPILLVLDALAVYRLTRLVTEDTILESFRDWVAEPWKITTHGRDVITTSGRRAAGLRYRLHQLIECPWCVSMWAAPPVVALQATLAGPWSYVAAALAFSSLTGLIARAV